MKISTFATLLVAAVPALGNVDYDVTCRRDNFKGVGDEWQYFEQLYHDICIDGMKCESFVSPRAEKRHWRRVFGVCIGCPEGLSPYLMGGWCGRNPRKTPWKAASAHAS
ncbi:hypothetical protein E4U54_001318 [Claviceps lovelessii]|nr:hypothetical protein E4U54_001318 [Claviceps lovelessii]